MMPNERVASLDDLLARCTVANEQHLSKSVCVQPEQIGCNYLGLNFPGDTTNAELNSLLPLYTELLKDLRENAETSPFLTILRNSSRDAPDASIILLYFLEFPGTVRTIRASVSTISECNVIEQFNCADLVDEISKNSAITNWCRGALSSSRDHHAVVLASCINILDSINRLPRQKAKKYLKKNVLSVRKSGSRDELIEGFQMLRSDLADVVSRDDVTRDASANAILFQMHTLITFFGEDDAIEILKISPKNEAFEEGISRHRHSFSEEEYQMFQTLLMSENQSVEEAIAGSQVLRSKEALGEFIECAKSGCRKEGTKRCSICKCVAYCSRDCQKTDWKAGHKKVCKKVVHPTCASDRAIEAARSIASPALRNQDDFLRSNPHIDYRIVLPTGSQDAGVVFPHPMGKSMFRMWRQNAPQHPFVYRMYEMLVENHPDKKQLIRRQLKDEYGVDPISDEAKQASEPIPTDEQIVNSLGPDMIFYPEKPLCPNETPSGASIRGIVGHQTIFEVTQSMLEGRIQKMWTQAAHAGQPPFGDHTPIILALLDAGIAQNLNETHRAESTTLTGNERKLKSQVADLERRVRSCDESFLCIPLDSFYYNLPHAIIKGMLNAKLSNQANLIGKVMEGYMGVRVWIHKKGSPPPDGSRPPDEDLAGPHPFKCGLRFQCGMTSAIASILIYAILTVSRVSSASEVFIFPHALIFASSKNGDKKFDQIIKGIAAFTPEIYKNSIESWCTSGKECTTTRVDGIAVKLVECDHFMEIVRKKGCSWYPLFSDSSGSSIVSG